MFTFLLSEGKYHLLLLPPRFGSESTNYHNWQMSSWENNGNCSCACSLPRHNFLKLKPEKLPCQNQQLCHQASRSQGSVVNAQKTPYLENFSYLKVFINTALQVCFTYRNKHSGNEMVTWCHYIICMTFSKEPQPLWWHCGIWCHMSCAMFFVIFLSSF